VPDSSAANNGLQAGDEFLILNGGDVHGEAREELLNEMIAACDVEPASVIVARQKPDTPSGLTPNTSWLLITCDVIS
jgi:hypothetical protein